MGKAKIFMINVRKRLWNLIRKHSVTASSISVVETWSSHKHFLSVLLYRWRFKYLPWPNQNLCWSLCWCFSSSALSQFSVPGECSLPFRSLPLFISTASSILCIELSHSHPVPSCYSTLFSPDGHFQLCLQKQPVFLSLKSKLAAAAGARQAFPVLLCYLITVLFKKTGSEQIKSLYNTLKLVCLISVV